MGEAGSEGAAGPAEGEGSSGVRGAELAAGGVIVLQSLLVGGLVSRPEGRRAGRWRSLGLGCCHARVRAICMRCYDGRAPGGGHGEG